MSATNRTPEVLCLGFETLVPPSLLLAEAGPGTVPAIGVGIFVQKAVLGPESPLYNVEHDHLNSANIGYLFTNVEMVRRGRQIVGLAEMPGQSTGNKWAKARAAQQLLEWFGEDPLDFLITLYAPFVVGSSPTAQMALLEHELYHCGQLDIDEIPQFGQDGRPKFCLRGHDVEEFVGVSRRYGVTGQAEELAKALLAGPEFGDSAVATVCGTCLR